MSKLILALSILGAGAGALVSARHSTALCQHQAIVIHETWSAQTQLLSAARSERVALAEHVDELKQLLTQAKPMRVNPLWCLLQTNRVLLPPEFREQLLEELGFNWESSDAYIFVSKEAVRDLHMRAIQAGKVTEAAASVLALTPEEREQVEAATLRAQSEFKDWALTHTERIEPRGDIVAQYTLENDPAMSISNHLAEAIAGKLGEQRAELLMPSVRNWMIAIGIYGKPTTLVVKRSTGGSKLNWFAITSAKEFGGPYELSPKRFPPAFRPMFPHGWSDLAQREGFELPDHP